jgi:hypothetical protein
MEENKDLINAGDVDLAPDIDEHRDLSDEEVEIEESEE